MVVVVVIVGVTNFNLGYNFLSVEANLRFVPVARVGSRRLMLLIPDLQAIQFCGSMPPRLQSFMSALTPSDHVLTESLYISQ